MSWRRIRVKQALGRLLWPSVYIGAFVFVPVVVGGATLMSKMGRMRIGEPLPLGGALPPPPAHDPARRTAVILAGNHGTESTDLLAPYEVLAASGEFNVYTVAPERRPAPLFPGTLDILPHFSFGEYEARIGSDPDLLVVPYIPESQGSDARVLDWIREHAGERTTILTICGGSLVLAESGLLDGRRATSHHSVLQIGPELHPDVEWVKDLRYVEDGNVISSAGVASGIDATLFTVQRVLGRERALEVARRIGYPHLRFLDDPAFETPSGYGPVAFLNAAFRWGRTEMGLLLHEGVREIDLASIIDTYPRSFSAEVHTLAPERRVVRSRHGLDLVPRMRLDDAPALRRVVVAGEAPLVHDPEIRAWLDRRGLSIERVHGGGFPYDATLRDMARRESAALASAAATGLEYPEPELGRGAGSAAGVLVTPVALGLLGVGMVAGLERRRRRSEPAGADRIRR